jgi:hypothetical protein
MNEPDHVAPLITMLHRRDGTLAGQCPDLAQDGLEPDPMFVDRPELDARVGEGRRHRAQLWAQTLF